MASSQNINSMPDPEFAGTGGTQTRKRRAQDAYPGNQGLVTSRTQDNIYRKYKGQLSVNLGLIEIFLQTVAIALNGVGVGLQVTRDHWISNFLFLTMPSVWSGIFVYLAASFAIAAGKYKYGGLIVTHMVMAIIGSIFAFLFLIVACGAVAFEAEDGSRDTATAIIGVIWVVLSLIMFIMLIWSSALCCQVSCGKPDDVADVPLMASDTGQGDVSGLNPQHME